MDNADTTLRQRQPTGPGCNLCLLASVYNIQNEAETGTAPPPACLATNGRRAVTACSAGMHSRQRHQATSCHGECGGTICYNNLHRLPDLVAFFFTCFGTFVFLRSRAALLTCFL